MIDLRGSKILIVDDNRVNVDMLKKSMSSSYFIYSAQNGEQTIELALKEKPDLILLDILMPGIDGYEVFKRLKSEPKTSDIPVIFITSKEHEVDETRALEMGAVDYIIKPFKRSVVNARVKIHLTIKKQTDLLRSLSNLDGLTGIPNRRHFNNQFDIEWRRCQRDNRPLAIVIMDIDYFKKYNDHYGHIQGDECLIAISKALLIGIKRASDFVARYGGEEFVAVLPNTDLNGALTVAQTFQDKVNQLHIEHQYSSVSTHVTLSLGLCAIVPTFDIDANQLVETADLALYDAKHSGRNQIKYREISIS